MRYKKQRTESKTKGKVLYNYRKKYIKCNSQKKKINKFHQVMQLREEKILVERGMQHKGIKRESQQQKKAFREQETAVI